MRMKGFTPKEFADLLIANGWKYSHHSSNHYNYCKDGCTKIMTVNFHFKKEMSRPLCKRLLKEAGINII
jgi:predicted RNA binding protein YcfA (HicA-like mRNA interferase family)